MGWDISVNNYGYTDSEINEIYLCADILDSEKPSRLNIRLFSIPSFIGFVQVTAMEVTGSYLTMRLYDAKLLVVDLRQLKRKMRLVRV